MAARGKKDCPKCGAEIAAASRKHDCGWQKEAAPSAPTGPVQTSFPQMAEPEFQPDKLMAAAQDFVKTCGGSEKAKRVLDLLREVEGVYLGEEPAKKR